MKKTLTITVTPGDDTRWLVSDETLAQNVRCLAGALVTGNTTGKVPQLEVTITDSPRKP